MIIKKAKLEDISDIMALQESILDSESPFTADEWNELLSDHTIFCAIDSQKIVCGALVAINDPSGDLKIDRLFVRTASRRNYVGETLIRRFIDMQNETSQTAFLRVAPDNLGAIALYDKTGFQTEPNVVAKYLTPSALEAYKTYGVTQNHIMVMTREPDDSTL